MTSKRSTFALLAGILLFSIACGYVQADETAANPVELLQYQQENSSVKLKTARFEGKPGIAFIFTGTDDLHYYANPETAAGGYNLKVKASAEGITFGEPIFPEWSTMSEPITNNKVEIYVGDFTVFIPIEAISPDISPGESNISAEVAISGMACTSKVCLRPFTRNLPIAIDASNVDSWPAVTLGSSADHEAKSATQPAASYSAPIAFALAILAGMILNVMPCVWPVLPIIITRLWNEAGEKRSRSITLGLAFSAGILCFFAALSALNLVLLFGYDRVFQWGDQLRNPVFLSAMGLLMVVLGLFMFGVFNIGIPASLSGKAGSGHGLSGSVGMGFLAALLATPCGGAILVAAIAWAQTQHWAVATITIMLIGVGMAIPYVLLVSIPGLLNRLPKPGAWMDHIKHAMGFLLILIAVKFLAALPTKMMTNALLYAVILSFCTWMWGTIVTFSTPTSRKLLIRFIALALAIITGIGLFAPETDAIKWHEYDAEEIQTALDSGQPVLIKFTADWCTTCVVVDKVVYKRRDIADLIKKKGILPVIADTTTSDMPATIDLASIYNEPAVPVTVVIAPDGTKTHLPGLISKTDLKDAIDTLPDTKASLE